MVKAYTNVAAIVEQLLGMLTLTDDLRQHWVMSEDGREAQIVAKSFKRIKGRLQIIPYEGKPINWRLSESVLDGIARHLILA